MEVKCTYNLGRRLIQVDWDAALVKELVLEVLYLGIVKEAERHMLAMEGYPCLLIIHKHLCVQLLKVMVVLTP